LHLITAQNINNWIDRRLGFLTESLEYVTVSTFAIWNCDLKTSLNNMLGFTTSTLLLLCQSQTMLPIELQLYIVRKIMKCLK